MLRVIGLPPEPADAAAEFHAEWLGAARSRIAQLTGEDRSLLLHLPEEDHTHAEWRLAAVRMLAREAAPVRVNLIGCDHAAKVERFAAYLSQAPGITGQYLPANFQYAR